jgi:hypothetical protein
MATTIGRFNWTDDTGTPLNPVGDGTEINDSELQALFDTIDDLIANDIIFGGSIATEKSGDAASFIGSPSGSQNVFIRNTAAGTGNLAQLVLGNDGAANAGRFRATSTTFTPTGGYLQNAVHVMSALAGGLKLFCDHASGFTMLGRRVGLDPNTPATLGANQTDYALGGTDAVIYFINTSVGGVRIDGIAGGFAGRMIWIVYVGGHTLTIGYNTGSAGNKVLMAAAVDVVMAPFSVAPFFHDGTQWWMGAKS